MIDRLAPLVATGAVAGLCVLAPIEGTPSAQIAPAVDFARDVQPLLRANCYGCHGPSLQNGNFRVDRRRDVLPNRVGANGARIVAGNSSASRLYVRISGNTAGVQMPPTGPLSADQITTIRTWIDQGADWPDQLAGDAPSTPEDPQAVRLMDALRSGRRGDFERLLRTSPRAARSKGIGGSTPLMYAALYSDAHALRLLLDSGADPNGADDDGATALMWAIDDAEKTRLLLSRGANSNAQSEDGATPIMLAAARFGAIEVVNALLDGGAKLDGQQVWGRAAATGDEALMRALAARGAARTTTMRDVQLAMRSGCSPCVDLLLESASAAVLNRALEEAVALGDSARVRMLLDRGASASSAGAPDTSNRSVNVTRSAPASTARVAVERALPMLQHADIVFLKKAGCISCHNNSLFQMTAAMARSRRFRIDEDSAAAQLKVMGGYLESWRERVLQDIAIPGAVDTTSYTLAGLAAARYAPDAATDALARYLARRQGGDGAWRVMASRPPIESSDFAVTALSIRALRTYAPPPLTGSYAQSIRRAVSWLARAEPHSTEDHVFRLLGLAWGRAEENAVHDATRRLIALQRQDGGWSQLPTLESDAYATGQALTALAEGGRSVKDSGYQNGVAFLLRTQLDDGSWFVHSRAVPIQPYFDSGFPHGTNQFISAAATNWATMALLRVVR